MIATNDNFSALTIFSRPQPHTAPHCRSQIQRRCNSATFVMPQKRQNLWCTLKNIVSKNDTMFGETYKVEVSGVEKVLTVSKNDLTKVCKLHFCS